MTTYAQEQNKLGKQQIQATRANSPTNVPAQQQPQIVYVQAGPGYAPPPPGHGGQQLPPGYGQQTV